MTLPNRGTLSKSPLIFVSITVALMIFVVLAIHVRSRPEYFDSSFMQWIHAHGTTFYNHFFLAATTVGGVTILGPIAFLTALALWLRRQRFYATFLLICLASVSITNVILKTIFHRHRPTLWHSAITETGFSFPSGHSMSSSAFALCIVIILWNTRWRWASVILGGLFTVAVGYSRMYFGVHYPSDVIGGWCATLIIVLSIARLMQSYKAKKT